MRAETARRRGPALATALTGVCMLAGACGGGGSAPHDETKPSPSPSMSTASPSPSATANEPADYAHPAQVIAALEAKGTKCGVPKPVQVTAQERLYLQEATTCTLTRDLRRRDLRQPTATGAVHGHRHSRPRRLSALCHWDNLGGCDLHQGDGQQDRCRNRRAGALVAAPTTIPRRVDRQALRQLVFREVGYRSHGGQEPIHASRARHRVLSAGRRIGKSTAGGRELLVEAYRTRFLLPSLAESGKRR